MIQRITSIAILAGCVLAGGVASAFGGPWVQGPTERTYTPLGDAFRQNSIGMKLVRIPAGHLTAEPGRFAMGFGHRSKQLPEKLITKNGQFRNGDFDEHPTHTVEITKPFYMGMFEVTNAQYEQFDPKHSKWRGRDGYSKGDDEAVVFVSWYDAVAFCKWLSHKEGKPYRLPTEAEWEYACRAGTTTPFYTGDTLPKELTARVLLKVGQGPPNRWGLYDMHGNVEEWCLDWYGPYEPAPQADPVGRVDGDFKVTRGGSHSTEPYYLRSANRSGTLPEDRQWLLGFRVVLGEMPKTKPLPKPPPQRYQRNVRQDIPDGLTKGPDPDKPYFKGPRLVVKIPEGANGPLFAEHNHFMAVTECPNGDLLACWFTCISEMGRELGVAASRLRYGQEEWEPASPFWDAPDRNDHTNALWYDGKGTLYHFNGLGANIRRLAALLRKSKDNGATWSKAHLIFPDHDRRRNTVVESIFRAQDGRIIVPFDGRHGSVIAISSDEGKTWLDLGPKDPGGSIRGTHAGVVQLRNGCLMAFGRHGAIDGKMPMSISSDMGKTWTYSPSPFQPIHSGRRVALMRLRQGPLFFASFCHGMMIKDITGKRRPVSGLFTAVSLDEGKTWPYRRLVSDDGPGRNIQTMDGDLITMDASNSEPVGYLGVCQSSDGLIHLLSSREHYAFNLKWLTTLPPAAPPPPPPPKAQQLPIKHNLPDVYRPKGLPSKDRWGWNFRGGKESDVISLSSEGLLKFHTNTNQQFWLRTEKPDIFGKVDPKKGFTAEIKTQVLKHTANQRGVDFELYDGAGSRYAITVTDTGVYWYQGFVYASSFLPFAEYVRLAEGLNNTDRMHTYRIAVRSGQTPRGRIAQIYRDGKLLGVKPSMYRTPRFPYIYIGAGPGVEALVEYVAYDLSGPRAPGGKGQGTSTGKEHINSIGMKLVRIKPGTFMLGANSTPLPDELVALNGRPQKRLKYGDYDENPQHRVTITKPFYISESEVTIEQFRKFRPDFPGFKARLDSYPYVSGISWYDAVAFCKWLSKKEGRPYRLPTEAEWEYACRAVRSPWDSAERRPQADLRRTPHSGTQTPFSSGYTRPASETPNPWGIRNMHTGVLEWCLDWYGPYTEEAETDPIGPLFGWLKVVRGGGLDVLNKQTMSFYFGRDIEPWALGRSPFYARSANRAAIPPSFAPPPREYQAKQMECINPPLPPRPKGQTPKSPSPYRAKGMVGGWHNIGFRVVQAAMPNTRPSEFEPPFFQRCVKQRPVGILQGPALDKPYYRTRRIFPALSTEQMVKVGWKIGLPPGLGTNQHNGALVVLPNGDLLACYYNGFIESAPDLSILVVRLRYGSEHWDVPSVWPDFLDGNDASPFIWNDNGIIWLGWGCPHLTGGYPFQWTISKDNGATWGPIQFPIFESRPGGYGRRQPINAVFRGPDKTIYIAFDGWGATSGLWASRNNGRTWYDTGGRALGLHATFVLLNDNSILSYGTRNRTIDGFCPRNVSTDWGKTWHVSRSPMPGQGGGQKPIMLKLASGRLLYVSNFQQSRDPSVKGFAGAGAYAGLSEDNGKSWRIRKLVGGQTLDRHGKPVKVRTVGYVGAAQSANGIIHLVTSRNNPDLHIELNEAWILQGDEQVKTATLADKVKIKPGTVKKYSENYQNGKPKVTWSAGIGEDGRYLLDGSQIWYYKNGEPQWETTYSAGEKKGTETYWNTDGSLKWQWQYHSDGTKDWTIFGSGGKVKAESHWRKDKLLSYKLYSP